MPLLAGEVFAGYTIIGLLGSGGMGEVYLARHPRLPRHDALKVLPREVSADSEFRKRFVREADLAATLWHPHIVGVHDRGEVDGRLWISMDYVDGTDAALVLRQNPAGVPVVDLLDIVDAVAEALDFAHQTQLLHRDVKPANILLATPNAGRRRILLADFGIARQVDDISGLTATNMTLGTVNYAAPEQLMGEEIDGRADQYALAATSYHLLMAAPLFDHTNPAVVISRHLSAEPPRLAQTRPELADLDRVFAVALAKNPADRFANCGDFAAALREAASGHSTQTALPVTPRALVSKDSTASPNAETQTAPVPPAPVPPPQVPNESANAAAGPPSQSRGGPRLTRTHLVVAAVLLAVIAIVAAFVLLPSAKRRQSAESATAPSTSVAGMPVPAMTTSTVLPHIAVPPDIAAAGKLIVGTNVPYTPAEYRDTSGKIVGFDIDLLDAVAGELGLTTEFRASAFDQLIPAVNTGDTNVAASYVTDTRQREQTMDMVAYYSGGSLWAQRPGAPIDPNNACGLRVAVQATTTQETDELPARSRACVAAGKPGIEILSFEGQDQATNALVHGQADAMSADSVVTGYAVRVSQGQIVAAGQMFDAAPVGWVVPKGSPLGPALQQALQRLIDSGRYTDILTKWGVEIGAIAESEINNATS